MSIGKRFPMQGGIQSIDWATAEAIYQVYSALYGKSQSLERMAERGGFGWAEVELICKQYKERFGNKLPVPNSIPI